MKRIHAFTLIVLMLVGSTSLITSPALAWEFELAGSFNWTYEWYNQTGHKGFFGQYNVDNGGATRAANLNFWNGGQFDTNITTSAMARWSYFNVEFEPVIKINPAIKMTGLYRLGTYGDPLASDYHTQDAAGTSRAFSEGQWTLFWVTAQTPIGVFGIGKRPWSFGNALQYDGEDAASTESITLTAPYGPLDIGIAFYPYRFAGSSSIAAFGGYDPYSISLYPYPGAAYAAAPDGVTRQYFSWADGNGSFSKDFLAFVMYSGGPFRAGILGSYGAYHIGPEAELIDPANPPAFPLVAQDSELTHGSVFMKYNNGRFFLNAEAAWLYWTDRFHADPGAQITPPNTLYIEQWRYMVELGAIAGPAKVSLLHAWTPGPDRRAGLIIGKQPAAFVWHPNYDVQLGNFDVFRPYSYLFSYNYGGGLNAYNLSGDGYLRDASVFAARADYAVASNLNVFGTFFYANRTSNGYSWGSLGPNAGVGDFGNVPDGNVSFNINRYPTSPNIPDTALGYEINAGLDWKLLEGWTAGVVVGYWQPGKWFNYACADRSVPGWEAGTAANNFGTRPGKAIDPIIGGEFSLVFDF
ncbi:hypothetical protein [Desulfomonile tiedjei]|uniref:Porin n=1 Tax=Desulfomonile tiedjei (strain ATCC 49306 / DSM 6799 / DCB-1) TaxID=706587 RepID=I4CDD5_DESTA|nr:hypothetical protein [Desulfomonile tiedjei]AFM27576.1 hypothetical protein Desti_4962 [Desulfomonile tiedjei DSM 6799]